MAHVRLENIHKSFGSVNVVRGVTLDIASGEFVSLLGASGCGKTTLLRVVAGLETVSQGRVEIDGLDVTALPPERRDISMMFQSYALLPHLSVAENVRFPLRMRNIGSRQQQAKQVEAALETVKLAHLADRRPIQLSGGQQQRVALARAIVSQPKVLLLDEPLSNLDARLREDMQVELIELHKRLGLTTIFVTHDQEEALSLSDRVVLLNDGCIEQQGAPADIYRRPTSAFSSNFLGNANLIPVQISQAEGVCLAQLPDGQHLRLATGQPNGPGLLVARQEDFVMHAGGTLPAPGLIGAVRTRIYLGSRNRYVVRVGALEIKVLAPSELTLAAGDAVHLTIDPSLIGRVAPDAAL